MSRYHSTGATGFSCRKTSYPGEYIISWTVDYYYPDSQLRYPRRFRRDTDKKGAVRFCRKHNIKLCE